MNLKRLCNVFVLLFGMSLVGNQAFATGAPKEKEWAFLIFLNGHNNLAEYGDLNINQLEKIGSTDDVDVIVEWAKTGFDKTYRLKVIKDNDEKKVTSPFVETMPRQDMGDWKNLVEFVRWSAAKYPAKRYFVSFWNHGSGWHRGDRKTPLRGVSYDDYSGNHITTEQMGLAMKEISAIIGHKVDIVGADACLMAMAEVGSEMADSVDHFVASEETEPGLGWPYDTFLQRWVAKPTASTAEISSYLVDEYYKSMVGKEEVTLSAYKVGDLPKLWAGLKILSQAILKLPAEDLQALRTATQPAVSFAYNDYVDMGDWLHRADAASSTDQVLLKQISDVVTGMVSANQTTPKFKDAKGIAFWVPPTKGNYEQYASKYANLRFAKETGWDQVVKAMVSIPVCALHKSGQWATSVTSFSSQYGDGEWGSKQVIGACDTDGYGDHGTSWTPKENKDTDEYIQVAFATPVHATGAIVRETMGTGFLTQIEAVDKDGVAHLVWKGQDTSPAGAVSDFKVEWPQTDYLVSGLKVSLTTRNNPGVWKELDSIQLIGAAR